MPLETVETILNAQVQPSEIFMFIDKRFFGSSSSLEHAIGKLDHLIDRLLAVELHYVFEGRSLTFLVGLSG